MRAEPKDPEGAGYAYVVPVAFRAEMPEVEFLGRKVWAVMPVQAASGSFDYVARKERELFRSG